MKYQHAQIEVEQPAPGHYSVTGLPPAMYYKENEGHIVAPNTLYVGPNVPDDLLETILADRKAQRKLDGGAVIVEKEKAVLTQAQIDKGEAAPVIDQNVPVHVGVDEDSARDSQPDSLGNKLPKRKYTPRAKKGAH